jgi:hypothetical protein
MFGLTASADQSAVAELVWSVGVILDVISLLSWILFWISAGSLSTVKNVKTLLKKLPASI